MTAVKKEPVIFEGYVIMPYKYSVGSMASKFFIKIRDSRVISGAKCPKCGFVNVPPRSVCPKCFAKVEELIDLSGKGTLETFTIVHYESAVQAIKPPYAIGVIKLDGADSGMTHFIGDADAKSIKSGMKLEPVFKDKREGTIFDIEYFRPAK